MIKLSDVACSESSILRESASGWPRPGRRDSHFQAAGQRRGRRDEDRGIRRLCPNAPRLSSHLKDWHGQSPQARGKDFVFPSLTAEVRVPLNACPFVKDHLRVAAKASGVRFEDGQRFGRHNLRHSLSNWIVNKCRVEPKTVQGLLRHSKIQTTLDLYTREDSDETRAAQGVYLSAMGSKGRMTQ